MSQSPSPHDKRPVHVSLTEKGVELGERLRTRDFLLAQKNYEGEQHFSGWPVRFVSEGRFADYLAEVPT